MTTPLTVAVPAVAGPTASLVQRVVASLPVSLALAAPTGTREPGVGADLIAVDGADKWVGHAAALVQKGVRGVYVRSPQRASRAELSGLDAAARTAGCPIVLATTWAGNPAVADARTSFAVRGHGAGHLEVHATVSSARETGGWAPDVLDLMTLVRASVGPLRALQLQQANTSGAHLHARTGPQYGGLSVSLNLVVCSVDTSATVRLVNVDGAVELLVPAPAAAQPGQVLTTTSEGLTLRPTTYESTHRADWRRLVAAVDGTAAHPDDLRDRVADDEELSRVWLD